MSHKKYTKERQEKDTERTENIQKEYCNETKMALLGQILDKEMIQKGSKRETNTYMKKE